MSGGDNCPICHSKALSEIEPDEMPRLPRRARRKELAERLESAIDELDTTSSELDRARAERDFYKELTDPDRPDEH